MRNFLMDAPLIHPIAESVRTNHHSGMKNDPVPYRTFFTHRNMGIQQTLIPDMGPLPDKTKRIQDSILSNCYP